MIPLDVFGSESAAADLLAQVRWRDGVTCPRCRSDRTVRNGSYRAFQRYLCKDCDRTFNDKTGTIFAHSKVALHRWLFSIYAFLRFDTSLS
jgi:transposase-like protein